MSPKAVLVLSSLVPNVAYSPHPCNHEARAIISSPLFSTKYFYVYIVKVVAKAPSIFPHDSHLSCPTYTPHTTCQPQFSFTLQTSMQTCTCILYFFPPFHPTGSFVSINCYACALSCLFLFQLYLMLFLFILFQLVILSPRLFLLYHSLSCHHILFLYVYKTNSLMYP